MVAALGRFGPRWLRPPAGNPGVNPSHFASSGLLFSGIPVGLGAINLRTGKPGTAAGITAGGVVNPLGPVAVYRSGGQADAHQFSGQDATNYTSNTIAAICSFNAVVATQIIFSNAASNAGVALTISSAGLLQLTLFGVVAVSSTITLVANVPYFIVASKNGSTGINWLVMRLDTGVITTAATASNTPNVGNGTYVMGNGWAGGSAPMGGNLAAVMLSSSFLPAAQLRRWAADPWAFWYPK